MVFIRPYNYYIDKNAHKFLFSKMSVHLMQCLISCREKMCFSTALNLVKVSAFLVVSGSFFRII